ncbi:MAG: ABC transporter permease [Verrucomicrobia bacterium]|nr:ABC transporter permease [Verrucomicrobiota bacterium]NBU09372.1 ABC transporter permease [Pseudomonadota bacterium]NDA65754.1 ABC transporter permease [Verrucomicrobiota bacterium]NDB76208.1 ABC transporter permease [Verrucomicrobiota bacterium]NDD37192.1 ABC transporter permease [Verrucomicrobiota bacterium]
MYHLALKMLLGDRAKYLMLVGGLTFATMLMTQQCGVFFGLLKWTTSHLSNMRAKLWVVDRKVEQANELKALRDTDVNRVRSVAGVAWAVPVYVGVQSAKLADGNFKPVMLVGLDNATLIGQPPLLLRGRLEAIRLPNSVIVDELAVRRLSAGRAKPLDLGDTFELNDREARIVGICRADKHFFGYPYVYSTYTQAVQFAPRQRKMLSLILAEPAPGYSLASAAAAIEAGTGMKAYAEEELFWSTIWWYFRNTGIPVAFISTILLGFIVGMVISGQTFYAFVHENLRHLGALKAMGASNGLLTCMLLVQAFTVGFIGYGMGALLVVGFGRTAVTRGEPPFMFPWQLPAATFALVMSICMLSALMGIRKVWKIEPAIVFRG